MAWSVKSIPKPARHLAGGKEVAIAVPLLQRLKHIEQGEAANHVRVQAALAARCLPHREYGVRPGAGEQGPACA